MRKLLFGLFLLFFLLQPTTALECNETIFRSMRVPAVNNDGIGQIVKITLEVKAGDGTAYIATEPIVGGMTQASGQTAMHVAADMAGYNVDTCDVLFKIGSGELTSIDGPSAGAAMTLMILSALKNETLPTNFTITGTIEQNGLIGPVGGIPEKAQAAANEHFPLLITPVLGVEDRLMLEALKENVDLTIAQVRDIRQAEDIVLGKLDLGNFSNPTIGERDLPVVKPIESLKDKRFAHFRNIAESIIYSAKKSIIGIPAERKDYADYFLDELKIAENALENGYLYTGANTAFITLINSEFLTSARANREEIELRIAEIEKCYQRALSAKMSENNWEWIIGGQVRASWAKNKILSVGNKNFESEINRLSTLKDLIYAEAWCNASEKFLMAQAGGRGIDQNKFRPIAAKSIKDAERYIAGRETEFSDPAWHLEVAKQEFNDGLYGAAAYDASYAHYMAKGFDDFLIMRNVSEVLDEGERRRYESIWASLYQSQMVYLRASGENGRVSLQLLEFSDSLENKTSEMKQILVDHAETGRHKEFGEVIIILIACTLLTLIFAVKKASER